MSTKSLSYRSPNLFDLKIWSLIDEHSRACPWNQREEDQTLVELNLSVSATFASSTCWYAWRGAGEVHRGNVIENENVHVLQAATKQVLWLGRRSACSVSKCGSLCWKSACSTALYQHIGTPVDIAKRICHCSATVAAFAIDSLETISNSIICFNSGSTAVPVSALGL
jgi:hypothetical protein